MRNKLCANFALQVAIYDCTAIIGLNLRSKYSTTLPTVSFTICVQYLDYA